ncbi:MULTISPECIES: aminoglycoside phosphotransferase family protein [unclassified Oleiphilus]|jgi:aminoglycoside/choline kinase family phosphotransferase|uniref:aminoglycoside phosphotransferase family protein n=2 Tax=Oleiphilus TaxID=141450 RepID=UPI0007C2CB80|nr:MULTISPECIES: phosphotransferase [unclassified Oleiphilus]KZY40047.1 aminoglycoside phosphotransferase [Oleiphilus sp. HI0050]KZY85190.1 aminoglycoside phosphotransferase [Oleiphilus sp. HI0069]KZY96315.1 aminoglycoside phosphotransferase [Oleiphilus sp. HI0072]KZZ33957.1 aminoglycoside phosphotransferase [Oleiphilus sp. HI0085]KZY30819.1 aminoglycoside phosphotransferase [Oleiphilus sp. HI0043]
MDQRYQALCTWVAEALEIEKAELSVVSGDASFRRYFRFQQPGQSLIAMDAPPEKEDSNSFVCLARSWREQGVNVPALIKVDLDKGFLLLSDLGDELLLPYLNPDSPVIESGNKHYAQAMKALLKIQSLKPANDYALPLYDSALLQREMALFPDWLLEKKLGLDLSEDERQLLKASFHALEESALAQPQVVVHRDYHARNLMVVGEELGIIDFQDAVQGPNTYDLVSLLRDCYIVWPNEQLESWCRDFYDLLSDSAERQASFEQFKRDFDLMGMQRHLKAAGIFARLSLRDGKHGYLNDIPRTVQYIVKVSAAYPEFQELTHFLEQRVLPGLSEKLGASS